MRTYAVLIRDHSLKKSWIRFVQCEAPLPEEPKGVLMGMLLLHCGVPEQAQAWHDTPSCFDVTDHEVSTFNPFQLPV